MNEQTRFQSRMFRGAKVSQRYRIEPAPHLESMPLDARGCVTNSAAFAIAKANEHKPWARRWLRVRRYL